MRAAVLHAHGAVPEVGEFRDPVAEPGSLVLDVLAGAINPVDVRIASGTYPLERLEPPYVAGKEGIGRRDDGGLVYFDARVAPFGAFAERTLISADHGYTVPSGLDPALAVCLGVSGLAAWLGLEWRGRIAAGETVLVLGASGVVGLIAVHAARLLGAGRVVAAARDEGALARAAELGGADALVPLGTEDLTAALVEASAGDGYDLVLDPLWGEPALAAIGAVRPFGRLVQVGQSAGTEATVPSAAIRNKPIELIGHTNFAASEERKAAAYERLAAHALAGELHVPIERLGLDDVPDAWTRVGSSPHAKLVVVP
jgi:NADPH:quinone reductase-like Zn-dependent oxidoreductase